MAHLVSDLDNLHIQYRYVQGKKVAFLLVWNAEMTKIDKEVPLSLVVAETLVQHGMSSGD